MIAPYVSLRRPARPPSAAARCGATRRGQRWSSRSCSRPPRPTATSTTSASSPPRPAATSSTAARHRRPPASVQDLGHCVPSSHLPLAQAWPPLKGLLDPVALTRCEPTPRKVRWGCPRQYPIPSHLPHSKGSLGACPRPPPRRRRRSPGGRLPPGRSLSTRGGVGISGEGNGGGGGLADIFFSSPSTQQKTAFSPSHP